jgi:hypothetical protein
VKKFLPTFTFLAILSVALGLTPNGESNRPLLPVRKLPALDESLAEPSGSVGFLELVNSGTLGLSYRAVVDGIDWIVVVSGKPSRVRMVFTESPQFQTPEKISAGNKVDAILAQYPGQMKHEEGWGDWVELPSGFSAFLYSPNEKPSPEAKVKFIFKRHR